MRRGGDTATANEMAQAWRLAAKLADALFDALRLDALLRRSAGKVRAHFNVSAPLGFIRKSLVLGCSFPTFGRPVGRLGALICLVAHERSSVSATSLARQRSRDEIQHNGNSRRELLRSAPGPSHPPGCMRNLGLALELE